MSSSIGLGGGTKTQSTQSSSNVTDSRSIVTNTLDGGAIQAAFDFASKATGGTIGKSLDYGQSLFETATDVISKQATNSQKGYENLFDQALDFAGGATDSAAKAYDRASSAQSAAMGALQGAYADAKGTSDSQKYIIYGVLGVAALVVLAPFLLKRA